jgi:hypothetical protein
MANILLILRENNYSIKFSMETITENKLFFIAIVNINWAKEQYITTIIKLVFCLKKYDLNYDYLNINGKYKEKQFLKKSFPENISFSWISVK